MVSRQATKPLFVERREHTSSLRLSRLPPRARRGGIKRYLPSAFRLRIRRRVELIFRIIEKGCRGYLHLTRTHVNAYAAERALATTDDEQITQGRRKADSGKPVIAEITRVLPGNRHFCLSSTPARNSADVDQGFIRCHFSLPINPSSQMVLILSITFKHSRPPQRSINHFLHDKTAFCLLR